MGAGAVDDDDEITGINVTPLVDVTLVLLIVFMVTTSSISRQEGMAVTKPEAATGSSLETESLLVTCTKEGDIKVDGDVMPDDDALNRVVAAKLAEAPDLQGILQCDEKAQVGTLVHLMDLLRVAGVKKYAIATRKPGTEAGG